GAEPEPAEAHRVHVGLEHPVAALAVALGDVHRGVGVADQVVRVTRPRVLRDGDSQARADGELLVLEPQRLQHKQLTIRASLGIAIAQDARTGDADDLIRNADAAMYIAKRDGKGGYRMFEPDMHAVGLGRLGLRA